MASPGVSSSVTFTVNATSGAGSNSSALLPSSTACVTASVSAFMSPSSTARTVTVCPVSHVVAVNVSVPGAAATAPASALVTSTTTGPVGAPPSATVYVASAPSVSASGPVPRLTAIAASRTFTVNVTSGAGSNSSALLASFTACVTVTVSAFMSPSSTARTVTVRPVFHVVAVNVSAPGAAVTAPASALVTSTTTGPVGAPPRATVYVVATPSVSRNDPVPRLTAIAASSSFTVTGRVLDTGSNSAAVSASTVSCVTFDVPPTAFWSSSTVTVTVCPVFQFDAVKSRTSLLVPVPPALRTV